MAQFIEAYIANGSVTFTNEEPEVPETSEMRGDVRYITGGTAGSPASFTVDLRVHSRFELDAGDCQPFISISVPVGIADKGESFRVVEKAAAKEIPGMLRAIADAVQKQIDGLDDSPDEATV